MSLQIDKVVKGDLVFHTHPDSDISSFSVLDALYVKLTGNETIAGIKTFSSFPITPSLAPTTNYQVANKKYVDDNAGGGGSDIIGYKKSWFLM